MILERFPELLKLTDEERRQLADELSGTTFIDEPVTDPEIIKLMKQRQAEYRRDPSTARPFGDVLAELRAKYIPPRRE